MEEGRRRQGKKRGKAGGINRRFLDSWPYYKLKEFGFYHDYDMSH